MQSLTENKGQRNDLNTEPAGMSILYITYIDIQYIIIIIRVDDKSLLRRCRRRKQTNKKHGLMG